MTLDHSFFTTVVMSQLSPSFCQRGRLLPRIFRECCQSCLSFYVAEKIYHGILSISKTDIKQAMSLLRPSTNTPRQTSCLLLLGQRQNNSSFLLSQYFSSKVINSVMLNYEHDIRRKNFKSTLIPESWPFQGWLKLLIMAWPIWLWSSQVKPIWLSVSMDWLDVGAFL